MEYKLNSEQERKIRQIEDLVGRANLLLSELTLELTKQEEEQYE